MSIGWKHHTTTDISNSWSLHIKMFTHRQDSWTQRKKASYRFMFLLSQEIEMKCKQSYGGFRFQSFCIGWHLLTLVFCVATCMACTNIHNKQSWCERLASADVDRCIALKSECSIIWHLSTKEIQLWQKFYSKTKSYYKTFYLNFCFFHTSIHYQKELEAEDHNYFKQFSVILCFKDANSS